MGTCAKRRALLKTLVLAAPAVLFTTPAARAATSAPRRLRFLHTHTGEKLDVVYRESGGYVTGALREIDHLLRDFRSGEVHPIDPGLLDILHAVQQRAGSSGRFEIISGFRSPATNEMLRAQGGGGVARRSLHMQGQAIDVRLSDRDVAVLQRAGLDVARGGVGYYPESGFVHLDTGRVRRW
jgi:uncharacterized protein YcbK (DUF882 family)